MVEGRASVALFHRSPHSASAAPASPESDSPAALRSALTTLNRFVNASAGRLPVEAVVAARRIGDVLDEVLDTAELRPLDVYAVLSVKGIITDYLPTTLRSYLAVDDSLVDVPRPTGRTPRQSLLEQLDTLESGAVTVLEATQAQDADTLMTQGNFLRTKYSGSDLDL
jgi:hypothetical protein